MGEDVVVVSADEGLGAAVQQLGRLVEHHVPRLHLDQVLVVLVVEDQQRPGLVGVLVHVDD